MAARRDEDRAEPRGGEPLPARSFDRAIVETPRTTGGAPAPDPAPAVVEAGARRSAYNADRLYRPARGGSVRVTHADGHVSYHGGATLLHFAEPPQSVEGDLEEAMGADDYAALQAALPADRHLPGRPKDDAVSVYSFSDLAMARYSLKAAK